MTVPVQIPYNSLVGDGSITTFVFTFDLVENYDLVVAVDGTVVLEYSDYTIENLTDDGGEVVFTEAPAGDVLIFRRTTMTQQVDYVTGEAFPAETHEWNLDKIVYILQELLQGVLDDGSGGFITFDLDAEQGSVTVTVTNSGGTDAVIPAWVSSTLAGVYHGETIAAGSLPADESVTSKPDGYIWLGI